MAKKERKKTRKEQYAETLANYGVALEDCSVLAFEFGSDAGPRNFHFRLIEQAREIYHFVDCVGKVAQIVMPANSANEEMVVQIAESCGGERITQNLR